MFSVQLDGEYHTLCHQDVSQHSCYLYDIYSNQDQKRLDKDSGFKLFSKYVLNESIKYQVDVKNKWIIFSDKEFYKIIHKLEPIDEKAHGMYLGRIEYGFFFKYKFLMRKVDPRTVFCGFYDQKIAESFSKELHNINIYVQENGEVKQSVPILFQDDLYGVLLDFFYLKYIIWYRKKGVSLFNPIGAAEKKGALFFYHKFTNVHLKNLAEEVTVEFAKHEKIFTLMEDIYETEESIEPVKGLRGGFSSIRNLYNALCSYQRDQSSLEDLALFLVNSRNQEDKSKNFFTSVLLIQKEYLSIKGHDESFDHMYVAIKEMYYALLLITSDSILKKKDRVSPIVRKALEASKVEEMPHLFETGAKRMKKEITIENPQKEGVEPKRRKRAGSLSNNGDLTRTLP